MHTHKHLKTEMLTNRGNRYLSRLTNHSPHVAFTFSMSASCFLHFKEL